MKGGGHFSRTLIKDQSASAALIFGLLLPVMIGFMGLAVDFGLAAVEKNTLTSSAEASAFAAAKYISATDRSPAVALAQSYAAHNRPGVADLVTSGGVEFGWWENGAFTKGRDVNAVRVTASRTRAKRNALRTYFAKLFGFEFWDVSASAVATSADPICILVLHPNHNDAFDIDPGAQIDAPECSVQVNSANRGSIEVARSAYVNVKRIRVVGGADISGGATVRPSVETGAAAAPDPYASLTPPVNNSCGGAKSIKTTTTITPAYAFCNGLKIDNATVTFSPGVYVIKDEFTLENGASIKGDGVLIYMEVSGSDIFFHSKTTFGLKAPTTGPYAGIVLWSDKRNTNDHDIYSKFGASAEGTIYAPSSQVEFENDVVWEAACIRIVVARLELDNNSKYRSSSPLSRCNNNIGNSTPRLVR